jgi:hypothetical protein
MKTVARDHTGGTDTGYNNRNPSTNIAVTFGQKNRTPKLLHRYTSRAGLDALRIIQQKDEAMEGHQSVRTDLLACQTVQFRTWLLTYTRNILPAFSV